MDLTQFLTADISDCAGAGHFTMVGDATPAGKSAMGVLSAAPAMTMTPGFAPSQSFLNELKGHLTIAAEAKYFHHG